MEARRALGVRHPAPAGPDGHQPVGLGRARFRCQFGYFGETFGRASDEPLPWFEADAEPNADMWATVGESREQIVALYRRAWAHSDATINALDLDAIGHVPWWPEDRSEVTLHHIFVGVVAETNRHAGHADMVRDSSTPLPDCSKETKTCHPETMLGGRHIGTGWRKLHRAQRLRAEIPVVRTKWILQSRQLSAQ